MVYLPNHSHCEYCGNPTQYGTNFCDDDCKALFEAQTAAEKQKDRRFYFMIGASLVVITIVGIIINVF